MMCNHTVVGSNNKQIDCREKFDDTAFLQLVKKFRIAKQILSCLENDTGDICHIF